MTTEHSDRLPPADEAAASGLGGLGGLMRLSWQLSLVLGLITLVIGAILAAHPTNSLNVIMILLGVMLLISGVYHIVRAFGVSTEHRVWRGIAGLICIVTGVVMVRHLNLSLAVIGLLIGFTWIVQGISTLIEVIAGHRTGETGWSVFFGIVSLIAGIVVVSAPIGSVTVLTVLMGWWFIVLGAIEMAGAFFFRRAVRQAEREMAGPVTVPGQRAESPATESPAQQPKITG